MEDADGFDRSVVRRRLRLLATLIVVFGLLHHADHVFRGNHSGWPFTTNITPFTLSLLIYPLLIVGLVQLSRDEIRPRYWLIVSLLLALLLTYVHFIPLPKYERISTDIFMVYADPGAPLERYSLPPPPSHLAWLRAVYGPHSTPIWGWLAVTIVVILTIASYLLVWTAWRSRAVADAR